MMDYGSNGSLVLRRIGRLLTMDPNEGLEGLRDAAIVVRDGVIKFVGREDSLNFEDTKDLPVVDAEGGLVTPGLVECHTHTVFAGYRTDEFEARGAGLSYEEVTRRGGGIMMTVRATRSASKEELLELGRQRLWRFLSQGVTTVEIKSGYGLTLESEIKLLEVINELKKVVPIDVVPTFLGAHTIPPEHRTNKSKREAFVEAIYKEWIPEVARRKLAVFCDCFCESVAFSRDEALAVLKAGLEHGLLPKLHADQLSRSGGASLAAELGAVSADHLDFAERGDLQAMARRGVVAVLLPGCALSLGQTRFPDAGFLRKLGLTVALSTDYNPGSSVTQNLFLMGTLAVAYMGLTVREAWEAITWNSAKAVGLGHKVGRVAVGYQADLLVFHDSDPRLCFYEYGGQYPSKVIKKGVVVVERSRDGEVTYSR